MFSHECVTTPGPTSLQGPLRTLEGSDERNSMVGGATSGATILGQVNRVFDLTQERPEETPFARSWSI